MCKGRVCCMKNKGFKLVALFCLVSIGLFLTGGKAYGEMPTMMDLMNQSDYTVNPSDQPKSAILIDANTGHVLWEDKSENSHNPASIMKLMAIYLTYEAMEQGKFNKETMVTATERHAQIAQIYAISNNNIQAGVSYPVKELIPMALVPSSNIATMMLAELVEPDAVTFLEKMNAKAQEMGMKETHIVNATGAEISAFQGLYGMPGVDQTALNQEGSNVTTAKDFAIFTYHLLNDYPDILTYTKDPKVTVMKGTPYEETFDTYNYSLPGLEYDYPGVDGLKTGSSPSGAFNIDMTAEKDGLRLIAVVFGVGDWSDQTGEYKRHPFTNAILDYGFSHFTYSKVLDKGEQDLNGVPVILQEDAYAVVKDKATPTFNVTNQGILEIETSLPLVSETVNVPQVKVLDKKGKDLVSSDKKAPKKKTSLKTIGKDLLNHELDFNRPIVKYTTIALLIIVILLLMMILILANQNRKRKKARKMRGKSGR